MPVLIKCNEWNVQTKKADNQIAIFLDRIIAILEITENDGEPACLVQAEQHNYFIAGSYEDFLAKIP